MRRQGTSRTAPVATGEAPNSRWPIATLGLAIGLDPERPAELDAEEHSYPLLSPDPDSRLPGGDFVSLRRQSRGFTPGGELHAWGLCSRNLWLDDMTGNLYTVLDLLAPHVEEPGYSGHFREEFGTEPTVFTFRNGTFGPLKL